MARSTTARPRRVRWYCRSGTVAPGVVLLLAWAFCLAPPPALAQMGANPNPNTGFNQTWVGVRSQPASAPAQPKDPNAQMLVKADELHYDYSNNLVTAIGNVQIYYNGSRLEANKVIYDQKAKRLRAEGNVWLREADGKIVTGEILDLDEDFRDGFVDSLRLEGADQTRFAAPRMERATDKITVFESGVYTACQPCADDPRKPPKWDIKAARIIHDDVEKMVYFENARLEFFDVPVFWWPFMSNPDPSVKRKTGWLPPVFSSSGVYGFAVTMPYYWALAPNYDLTVTPTVTSIQGLLLQAEWRQRLENGQFTVHGAGINQLDPGLFEEKNGPGYPGDRVNRGSLDSSGKFALSGQWTWGWDAMVVSDKTFFQDYGLNNYLQTNSSFQNFISDAGTSQVYLTGRGDRSYFDARVIYTYGLSLADTQSQLPVIYPVIDYAYTFGQPIVGGELSYKVNLTNLSRESAEFDAISQNAIDNNLCLSTTANPMAITPANCLLRGIPGTYSRLSAEATWRTTITDSHGQIFIPFVSLRGDLATATIDNQPGVSNFITPGTQDMARVMPTVGLEYRYPFISAESWGTQTIEPIAQLIVRPNETYIGRMPNEDAQSLIFDDSNLFKVDKFSGWDREEGGTRVNYGAQYTAQFNQGGTISALVGQSYQLLGLNSFSVADTANTGLDSGLETRLSDYVARLSYQPDKTYMFTARFRIAEDTYAVERAEFEAKANFDRWTTTLIFGDYAAQPDIGFLTRRDGILSTTQVKITPNWSVLGSARYDLTAGEFDQYRLGFGYIDDCLAIAVNYITDYSYGYSPTTNTSIQAGINHTVMLQLSLRTLGGTSFTQTLSTTPSSN
ncbi:MAG TPA: LPS-assembly protein LptD [Xanthobacteraceae bacterium]|nr:LPS-assembly protein LptD [Xanthobacteraceae bacterium]